jgi:hypothetical protein
LPGKAKLAPRAPTERTLLNQWNAGAATANRRAVCGPLPQYTFGPFNMAQISIRDGQMPELPVAFRSANGLGVLCNDEDDSRRNDQ